MGLQLFILTFELETEIPIYGEKAPETCLETHFNFLQCLRLQSCVDFNLTLF